MGLHYISEAGDWNLDFKDLDHLLIDRTHHRWVSIQQAADGSHGNGPFELSAADKRAASSKDFFLLEADFDETFMLIGPGVKVLWLIHDFIVDPESPTYGF